MEVQYITVAPIAPFPNSSRYPLIVYRSVVEEEQARPEWFEDQFSDNGWGLSWRNGIYSFHHFHSSAHEVLGCYSGSASVMFGGPEGAIATIGEGDAVVIPAGVAHCLVSSTTDFHVVGAYPDGTRPDTMQGRESEYPEALIRSEQVPIPLSDPLAGEAGPIIQSWKLR